MTPRQKALEDLLDVCRDLKGLDGWTETHLEIIKQVEAFDRISPTARVKPLTYPPPSRFKIKIVKSSWSRQIVYGICYSILTTLPIIFLCIVTFFGG